MAPNVDYTSEDRKSTATNGNHFSVYLLNIQMQTSQRETPFGEYF